MFNLECCLTVFLLNNADFASTKKADPTPVKPKPNTVQTPTLAKPATESSVRTNQTGNDETAFKARGRKSVAEPMVVDSDSDDSDIVEVDPASYVAVLFCDLCHIKLSDDDAEEHLLLYKHYSASVYNVPVSSADTDSKDITEVNHNTVLLCAGHKADRHDNCNPGNDEVAIGLSYSCIIFVYSDCRRQLS